MIIEKTLTGATQLLERISKGVAMQRISKGVDIPWRG
jgi:hypothetical protein